MNKNEFKKIIKLLSKGFILGKIDGLLYSNVCESLIATNLSLVPELEYFADFLAQYHSNPEMSELYGNNELKKKIKEVLKIK